jgi:hypothetical protein
VVAAALVIVTMGAALIGIPLLAPAAFVASSRRRGPAIELVLPVDDGRVRFLPER